MISVSAVMPTRGRQEYAAQALKCYLSQTWQEKELVILDDADKPSFERPPEGNNIRYILLDKRHNIPDKRNMVCREATGDIIVHFDSDDWSAPTRIAAQIELMEREKKAVCGFRQMYFWNEIKQEPWIYRGLSDYVLGTSLMFKRSWWAHNHWDLRFKVGSDNIFVTQAAHARQLISSQVTDLMVARNHGDNTSPKRYGLRWKKCTREEIPAGFFSGEYIHEIRSIEAPADVPSFDGNERRGNGRRHRIVGR